MYRLTPNVAEYVFNTLHLRCDRTELYKLLVDRPNIRQFVRQVERIDDFSVLSRMPIPDLGALWTIPKAIIFVDDIDKWHKIARCFGACIHKRFAKDAAEMAIIPFSANLESSTRETFMQHFTTATPGSWFASTLQGWVSMCGTWTWCVCDIN